MKKMKYLLFTLIMMFSCVSLVFADETYRIDVEMQLDEKGNASIVETWDFKADNGTEIFKPMGELGNSKITNFKASMDGTEFTFEPDWDIDASLNEKAYKNGINYTEDGIELCIGKTSYGRHKYVFSYDVSNVIYNVEDAQILYWKFINDNMDHPPKEFFIKVTGPNAFDHELPVWGYGYVGGYAYVYDGVIEMSNGENKKFKSSEYAVLLAEFPLNTFDTNNSWAKFQTFDDVLHLAQTGSFKMTIWDYIVIGIMIFIGLLIGIIIAIAIYVTSKDNSYIKNKINVRDVNPFRDIPCDKNILNAYLLAKIYNVYKKKEDLFGAALLKWVLDGTVMIREEEKEGTFKVKKTTSIDMTKEYQDDTPLGNLYNMLKEASGDGILETKELEKWCTNNYDKLYKWFDEVETYARDNYINRGLITCNKNGKVITYKTYTITEPLEEQAKYLIGLKKFLKDVTEIHEKQPIEVHLWEYYLMYAQIFGIAKEVAKQFKDLYPELVTNQNFDYNNVVLVNNMTTRSVNAASAAKIKAESYSAGGGGGSFGGGGIGSFGGGSGGGGR